MTAYQDYPTDAAAADTKLLAEQGDQTLVRVPYPFGYATSADIDTHDADAAAHPAIQSDVTAAQGDATTALARVPPAGGTIGQLLAKLTGSDYSYEWIDPPAGGGSGNVPVGGATGQVLAKASAVDYDTEWVDAAAGGGGGANLAWDQTASTVTSDSGTDATLTAATTLFAGLMTASDKVKLNGVETGATADQTGAEIKALYEAQTDTNAFTDAEKSKLGTVESGATADMTATEIKTAYESNFNTNAFTDAEKSKLTGVENGATADQTGAEIKALYEALADTNAFTDAEKTKLAGVETGAQVTKVPTGGTVGQALVKASGTNYDTAWQAVAVSVEHGATASVARPAGAGLVIWVGSVQPTNAAATDLVVRTDEAI